jgi:uncharacterized protein DUF6064
MSEWWTYDLSDLLMFSPETYYRLFHLHNEAIWPAQILALAAGLALVGLMLSGARWSGRAIAVLLAASWLLVAASYFPRLGTIHLAASYFTWGFAAEAALLLLAGIIGGWLTFTRKDAIARTGIAIVVFALLVQPLIGPLLGRTWSGVELFGSAPDPTVLATLGVLLAADRLRLPLLAFPLLWCAISGITLWTMHAPEALLIPAGGLLTLVLAIGKTWRARRSPKPN